MGDESKIKTQQIWQNITVTKVIYSKQNKTEQSPLTNLIKHSSALKQFKMLLKYISIAAWTRIKLHRIPRTVDTKYFP